MANCANLFGECNYFSTVFERGFPLPKQTHCIIELDISHSNGTWESLSEYIRIKYWITIQMKSAQEEVKIAGIQNGRNSKWQEFKIAGSQQRKNSKLQEVKTERIRNSRNSKQEFNIAGSQNRKKNQNCRKLKQKEFKFAGIQNSRNSKLEKVKIVGIQNKKKFKKV